MVILSGVLYGSLGVFGTLLIHDGFSVSAMLFWRFFAAALTLPLLGPSAFRTLCAVKFTGKGESSALRVSLLVLLNAFLYSSSSALFFVAAQSIGTGLGMVIFYSYPVFIFLWLLLVRQNISIWSWISLLLVLAGMALLNPSFDPRSAGQNEWGWGFFCAILSCVGYAAYILLSKNQVRRVDPLITTFVLCGISSLYFFILMLKDVGLKDGGLSVPAHFGHFGIIFLLGFVATALPIFLMLKGLEWISPDQAAIFSVFEPVITVLLGALFLKEKISFLQGVGVCVVLAGAVISSLAQRRKNELKKPANGPLEAS